MHMQPRRIGFFVSWLVLISVLSACGGGGGGGGDNKDTLPKIVQFISSAPVAFNGAEVTLSWEVQQLDLSKSTDSLQLLADDGSLDISVAASGSQVVAMTATRQFELRARNAKGEVQAQVKVWYGEFSLLQEQILQGQTTKLQWWLPDAEKVLISPDVGEGPGVGEADVAPLENTDYVLRIPAFGDAPQAQVSLRVDPPVAMRLQANPLSGSAPLRVRFSPVVENNNQVITSYQWDFTSDGIADVTDTFGAPQTFTYTGNPGDIFTATLSALTASDEVIVAKQAITLTNQLPSVTAAANVSNGIVPLAVQFSVTASDADGLQRIRIDFDGDDSFDQEQDVAGVTSGTWNFATSYAVAGLYAAVIEVSDRFGGVTRVTNNSIRVNANEVGFPHHQLDQLGS